MKKCLVLPVLVLITAVSAAAQPAPTELEGLAYDVEFFPGTPHDPAIPTVKSLVGFRPKCRPRTGSSPVPLLPTRGHRSPPARRKSSVR